MTDHQAYCLACEALMLAMKAIAFDANIARLDKSAPPAMQARLTQYNKYAEALRIMEGMKAQKRMEMIP